MDDQGISAAILYQMPSPRKKISPPHTPLPYSRDPTAFLLIHHSYQYSKAHFLSTASTIHITTNRQSTTKMSNGTGNVFGRAEEKNAGDLDDLFLSKFSRMTTVYVPPTTPPRKTSSAIWGNNYNNGSPSSSNQVYFPLHHHLLYSKRVSS